jgi:DNA-binding phage protein
MDKKKILKKQEESCQKGSSIEGFIGVKTFDPMEKLLNKKFTLEAIFECISNGDVAGAKEVFSNYLWAVNKSRLSKDSHISRSTIAHCLEHKNPTFDTFLKVMSA